MKGKGVGPDLSESLLQRYAGQEVFEQGVAYFDAGRVTDVGWGEGTVQVRVHGGAKHPYTVHLWQATDGPGWACDCPVGERGGFCKHAVVAGLIVLAEEPEEEESDTATIRGYLESLEHASLVALLMEQVERDETLATRLASAALPASDPGSEQLRQFVTEALGPDDFVGWGDRLAFLERADTAVTLLEQVANERPAMAADLAITALAKGFAVVEDVDDSDGQFGELLFRLGRLLAQVQQARNLRGEALAEILFPLLQADPFDVLPLAPFQDLLGAVGLDWLRDEAQRQIDGLPQPRKREKGAASGLEIEGADPRRRALVDLQEKVAQARGRL